MKERIDHSNYEAWLLDRLEGRLSDAQERALTAFLALHPELDPDGEELPSVAGGNAGLLNDERTSLKRHLPPQGLPTRATLDDFLIARGEGDLNAEQERAVQVLLNELPDGERRARVFAAARITADTVRYEDHGTLVRALPPVGLPTAQTLGDFLIAQHEGDLDATQRNALEQLLATDASARREQALIIRARIPATPVVYPDKSALKRGAVVIPLFARTSVRWAAAASIAVLLGLGLWALQGAGTAENEQQLAKVEPPAGKGTSEGTAVIAPQALPSTTEAAGITTNNAPQPVSKPTLRIPRGTAVTPPAPVTELVATRDDVEPALEPQQEPTPQEAPVPVVYDAPEPTFADAQTPENAPTEAPSSNAGSATAAVGTAASAEAVTVRGLLTRAFRRTVLEQPDAGAEPLSGDDALAAVDAGLRAVAGERAGLRTERNTDGGQRRFDLRLGRGFSISGSR